MVRASLERADLLPRKTPTMPAMLLSDAAVVPMHVGAGDALCFDDLLLPSSAPAVVWPRPQQQQQQPAPAADAPAALPHKAAAAAAAAGDENDPHEPGASGWNVRVSERVLAITNPIRQIVEAIRQPGPPACGKPEISLAVGDPTVFGHLAAPAAAVAAVADALARGEANGYAHSSGLLECRAALAAAFSPPPPPPPPAAAPAAAGRGAPARAARSPHPALTPDDVFVTSGCSQALEHALVVLAGPGRNVLLPRPGFPLYQTICEYHGIETRFYDLKPDDGWQVDVPSLARLADARTAALVLTNPSNPTGAVYSAAHLRDLLAAAEALRLVVIADEVYAEMHFEGDETSRDCSASAGPGAGGLANHVPACEPSPGEPSGLPPVPPPAPAGFVPAAAIASRGPVMTVGSLSKRWLVPGWRLGWLCVHDAGGVLAAAGVRGGLARLAQITLGPNSLVQAAVPRLLRETPPAFYAGTRAALAAAAARCVRRAAPLGYALEVSARPQGAMYLMLRLVPGGLRPLGGAGEGGAGARGTDGDGAGGSAHGGGEEGSAPGSPMAVVPAAPDGGSALRSGAGAPGGVAGGAGHGAGAGGPFGRASASAPAAASPSGGLDSPGGGGGGLGAFGGRAGGSAPTPCAAFCAALHAEEAVMLLPGAAFGAPGYVRVMFAAPDHLLEAAWDRIAGFCARHRAAAAPARGP